MCPSVLYDVTSDTVCRDSYAVYTIITCDTLFPLV